MEFLLIIKIKSVYIWKFTNNKCLQLLLRCNLAKKKHRKYKFKSHSFYFNQLQEKPFIHQPFWKPSYIYLGFLKYYIEKIPSWAE